MLEELYRTVLSGYLSRDQLITLEMLVWLIQTHKQVKIERLAAYFPLAIKYESRRRRIQRLLKLPALSVTLLWLPIIQQIIARKFKKKQRLYIVIDRTQWKERNLFMVAVVFSKRALPIYWQFLSKKGASNLGEQKALLRPVLKLLKDYELVVLGDREFHSVALASWLTDKDVYFVLRQKKSTQIELTGTSFQPVMNLAIFPGNRLFLQGIKVRKRESIIGFYLGIYWQRSYRGKGPKEPWYLLTNLPNLTEALQAYRKRGGIEAMFKDCKTGGYNLEGSQANIERLTRLVLLIAIAYTHSSLTGQSLRHKRQSIYLCRQRKMHQENSKSSNFWLGLYGSTWRISFNHLREWVEELIRLNPNKLTFYQRGQRAMSIIQQAF